MDCVDWLIGWFDLFFVFGFYLVGCLAPIFGFPWALRPLLISAGPSWFYGTGFSDGEVQKLDANST